MSVKNIMIEIEGLIKNTVISCASLYGFSVLEALAKIDSNGNLVKAVVDKELKAAEKLRAKEALVKQKEAEKVLKEAEKEAEKAEKLRLKESEKALVKQQKEAEEAEKLRVNEAKEAEKLRLKEAKEAEKLRLDEAEKAEKLALKQAKEAENLRAKEAKKVKKVAVVDEPWVARLSKEDDDCFVRFQNVPLIKEINSIRDVKKFKNHKKLSVGVKLARQIMDI